MSRGRIISMTVSTGDGYFVAMVDTGRVRVGQRGGTCYEFPIIHPKAREAMSLTESTVCAFHSACESLPFQYNMTRSTGELGYRLPLFHALDSADLVAIDGVELMPRYRELAPARRLVRPGKSAGSAAPTTTGLTTSRVRSRARSLRPQAAA